MKTEYGLKEHLPYDELVSRDKEYVERICNDRCLYMATQNYLNLGDFGLLFCVAG